MSYEIIENKTKNKEIVRNPTKLRKQFTHIAWEAEVRQSEYNHVYNTHCLAIYLTVLCGFDCLKLH